jgi:glycosyltransferase involved in cell wall biosynthesis
VSELVSVIIPAFNAAKYLGDAVDSVVRQSHDRVEIVVIDDGSTDDTLRVAIRFGSRVRYVFQPHAGLAAARNHGVHVASGGYLAFLDADDLWEPQKLATQLTAFDADRSLDIVFGHVIQFWSPELSPPDLSSPNVGEPMDGYHPGAMLVTRAAFDRIGLFREDHELGEFIEWYSRALDYDCNITMLPSVVMRRRLHETNLGRVNKNGPEDYARVLRRVIDRRRGRNA